ncbi:hypothetical protein [Actinoplanes sp. NPDC089786]|uniref:hypothetical protein n=1 Tax=Actinoplanes sp. NPDC089786 TaxID=3155185 RepID=UPI003442051C
MNLDDQLRRHDPARDVPAGLGRSPRAVATLARLTANDPGGRSSSAMSARPARRRLLRYAMAAIVAAAGVVLAPILGTDDDAALATWDAKPHPVTAEEAERYAKDCASWTQVGYPPQIIEVRGTWVMTYLASAGGEAQCLRSLTRSAEFPDGEGQAQSSPLTQTPAADALATVGVMETSGGVTNTQFLVAGKVGAEVTAVVFRTQGMRVQATVKNGRFTAWWPRRKPASLYGRLMDNTGWNGSPNPKVTITLSDGRTITKPVKEYDVNH